MLKNDLEEFKYFFQNKNIDFNIKYCANEINLQIGSCCIFRFTMDKQFFSYMEVSPIMNHNSDELFEIAKAIKEHEDRWRLASEGKNT